MNVGYKVTYIDFEKCKPIRLNPSQLRCNSEMQSSHFVTNHTIQRQVIQYKSYHTKTGDSIQIIPYKDRYFDTNHTIQRQVSQYKSYHTKTGILIQIIQYFITISLLP